MNIKKMYRHEQGFYELVKKVIAEGEPVHSSIEEGLNVYLYNGKQYNIISNLDLGVTSYITILW